MTTGGNFEGTTSCTAPTDAEVTPLGLTAQTGRDEIGAAHAPTLLDARAKRVWPGRDDEDAGGVERADAARVRRGRARLDRDDYRRGRRAQCRIHSRTHGGGWRVCVRKGWREPTSKGFLDAYLEDLRRAGALALYSRPMVDQESACLDRAKRAGPLGPGATVLGEGATRPARSSTPRSTTKQLDRRPRESTDNVDPLGGAPCHRRCRFRAGGDSGLRDMRRRVTVAAVRHREPMAQYPLAFGHAAQPHTTTGGGTPTIRGSGACRRPLASCDFIALATGRGPPRVSCHGSCSRRRHLVM